MTHCAEEIVFMTARENVSRGCVERYRRARGITKDSSVENRRLVEDEFRLLGLLLDPALHAFAHRALGEARGPIVFGQSPFPAMLWKGGATMTKNGEPFTGTLDDFVTLLHERAAQLAPKRMGWVIEPVTNTDGHRTNTSTTAVHALFLDCDGRGTWDVLLQQLRSLGFAFVAYQSGGHTATTPKWRVVLPLTQAFSTRTESEQQAWKMLYHHARVVFGAVAQLHGEGFDPATDPPCIPWFLTERRSTADPPREIVYALGYSLDLMAFALALPTITVEPELTTQVVRAEAHGLSDEKLEALITGLSKATAHIPSGRHELYLALPGVLLARGVPPEEVLAVIEAVSASYPRKHADKHRDNVHNAKTTIARWQAGGKVTQIGTLNERWPEIAQVVDAVLPNPLMTALANSMATIIAEENAARLVTPGTLPTLASKKRKLPPLGHKLLPILKQMKQSKNARRRYASTFAERIIYGESFATGQSTPAEIDTLVSETMNALGYSLAQFQTSWREMLDLAQATLDSMNVIQSIERVAAAERAFLNGQAAWRKVCEKHEAKKKARKARLTLHTKS